MNSASIFHVSSTLGEASSIDFRVWPSFFTAIDDQIGVLTGAMGDHIGVLLGHPSPVGVCRDLACGHSRSVTGEPGRLVCFHPQHDIEIATYRGLAGANALDHQPAQAAR